MSKLLKQILRKNLLREGYEKFNINKAQSLVQYLNTMGSTIEIGLADIIYDANQTDNVERVEDSIYYRDFPLYGFRDAGDGEEFWFYVLTDEELIKIKESSYYYRSWSTTKIGDYTIIN